MTKKEIFAELSTTLTRERIVEGAIRDNEKPMGFLITYIRDMYGLPKTEGRSIAEDLLKFFDLYYIPEYYHRRIDPILD